MDYRICKTVDGKSSRVIYQFTQKDTNHKAKRAAQRKLDEMWLRIINRPDFYKNATGAPDEFSYDHPAGVDKYDRIRFYIEGVK